MRPETFQIAVLVAAGVAIILVPLLLLWLAERVRNVARESTDRALGEYARQHEQALAALQAEHQRIAQEFGLFTQKRHEVYARLYARYRRAANEFGAPLGGHEPEFKKFSRDDLFRYLRGRKIREIDAADAIAALDRGDTFAMGKLMSKLHWRVTMRDANVAFDRAKYFGALNELYLSDKVLESLVGLRRTVEALSLSLMRDDERADAAKTLAKQNELESAVATVLHTMRDELGRGRADGGRAVALFPHRPEERVNALRDGRMNPRAIDAG